MNSDDTICALATAPGGAVAIIRLSGKESLAALSTLWHPQGNGAPLNAPEHHRRLRLGELRRQNHGELIDPQCLAVYMPGPNSYTGEDVVELHLHGGGVTTRMALEELLALPGIRGADHGEFTRRAFLNGKMDLTQAEAVADILSAESEAAAAIANRQLAGLLGRRINAIYDAIHNTLAESESRLDFPEEEIQWQPGCALAETLRAAAKELLALAESAREGEVLRKGLTLAIAGAPNAGKSSLLNRLLGRDRAIVSPIPGTTRDTVEADFILKGIPIHLVDTAGIRQDSSDQVEAAGIQRSQECCAQAHIILWLQDGTDQAALPWPNWHHQGKVITLATKADLPNHRTPQGAITISAQSGQGLEELFDAIEEAALGHHGCTYDIAVSPRHGALLKSAAQALQEAAMLLEQNEWALAAIPMRQAQECTGQITGREVSPDILDNIFHRFCIGK